MKNKPNLRNTLSPTPLFFLGLNSLRIFSAFSYQWCRGMGNVASSSKLSLLPPQGEDSSLPYPAPAWMGSLPRETVLHELLIASHSHGLQFFTNCPRVTEPLSLIIAQASGDTSKHLIGEDFSHRWDAYAWAGIHACCNFFLLGVKAEFNWIFILTFCSPKL